MLLSLSCLKTERLSDLPQFERVCGGRDSTGVVSLRLRSPQEMGGPSGDRPAVAFIRTLAEAQQEGLQGNIRAAQDPSKAGRITREVVNTG